MLFNPICLQYLPVILSEERTFHFLLYGVHVVDYQRELNLTAYMQYTSRLQGQIWSLEQKNKTSPVVRPICLPPILPPPKKFLCTVEFLII